MLELDNVHVYYGRSHVLQGVSLTVRPGEVVALLGRNGAGKTTTLRSIAGLMRPSAGTINADGKRLTSLPPHRIAQAGVSFVASGNALLSSLTVKQNLILAHRASPTGERVWDLDAVGDIFPKLGQMWDRRAGLLSGGERQMLKVGRGLLMNPRYLLLDEPTEGLAPVIVKQLGEALRTLRGSSMAILLCEQNANFAMKLAERLYVMDKGVIRLDEAVNGASREMLNRLLAVGE